MVQSESDEQGKELVSSKITQDKNYQRQRGLFYNL
jgi:hypothetical protein